MTRRRLTLAGSLHATRQDDALFRRHFLNPLGVDAAERALMSNVESEVAKRFTQFEQSIRGLLMSQKRRSDHSLFPAGQDPKKHKGKGEQKGQGKGSVHSVPPLAVGRRPMKFLMKSNKYRAM